MKQKFSTKWIESKQPRKQRKYRANAPLHLKRKLLSAGLSAGLKIRLKKRSKIIQKGDKVKILKGRFKNKDGKVLKVLTKVSKITIEGITVSKRDGSKVEIKFWPWDVKIIETASDAKKEKSEKIEEKPKKENKETKTETKEKK